MKQSVLFVIIFLLVVCIVNPINSYGEQKQACKTLSTELADYKWLKDSPLKSSGQYCLTKDILIKRAGWLIAEGREYSSGGDILRLSSSNITLELKTHTLNAQLSGLSAISFYNPLYNYDMLTHIVIRNGMIISRTNYGILDETGSMGVKPTELDWGIKRYASDLLGFVDFKNRENDDGYIEIAQKDLDNFNKTLAVIRDNFPLTEHTIDNVKVSAVNIGIGIKGGGNIIRNSVIMIGANDVNWWPRSPKSVNESGESWGGGTASIYLFGPNQLIENNIIIFKGKTRTSRSSAAPIKIHAADGTIIRNNTIIIESSGDDIPQTAISIFDSKNVIIENNQIFGTKSVYKIWDEEDKGSSVKETGTAFPPFWKKPRPSF